jgi:hypothetical protein
MSGEERWGGHDEDGQSAGIVGSAWSCLVSWQKMRHEGGSGYQTMPQDSRHTKK